MEIIFITRHLTPLVGKCAGEGSPHARVREWKVGDNNPADYALVWQPRLKCWPEDA
ncbi:hypothetical protein JT306_08680 [Salmonella enterica subsp. enterica serovar Kentucky]|nr:hypothetical protein [Salmonella enterica subsp. enterica serovar Kentucky]